MDLKELADRVERSPKLRKLQKKLLEEIEFRADNSAQFDPVTIIMIISIVVQVIIHCRENRSDAKLFQDIRDIRALPARRLIRLRRRMNALWREQGGKTYKSTDSNPLLAALYEVSENTDETTLKELLKLADEE